jgi:hypothetical protein
LLSRLGIPHLDFAASETVHAQGSLTGLESKEYSRVALTSATPGTWFRYTLERGAVAVADPAVLKRERGLESGGKGLREDAQRSGYVPSSLAGLHEVVG